MLGKAGKVGGDRGFKSNHLIHSAHCFYVTMALHFNTMLVHGYTSELLLTSSIIQFPMIILFLYVIWFAEKNSNIFNSKKKGYIKFGGNIV